MISPPACRTAATASRWIWARWTIHPYTPPKMKMRAIRARTLKRSGRRRHRGRDNSWPLIESSRTSDLWITVCASPSGRGPNGKLQLWFTVYASLEFYRRASDLESVQVLEAQPAALDVQPV